MNLYKFFLINKIPINNKITVKYIIELIYKGHYSVLKLSYHLKTRKKVLLCLKQLQNKLIIK